MTMIRLARPLIVVAAAIAFTAACGDKESTPAGQPATAETQVAPATPSGPPGAPHIVFFDRDTALQTSLAGRSMIQQATQLRQNAQRELQGEGQRLQADAQAFRQQASILAAGVRAQRTRDLENRQASLQRKAQLRSEQIQAGFRKALEQFSVQMQPILQQIMRERGANLLLDRTVVLMSQSMGEFDITPLAVQRLNATVKTIPVALVTPPAAPRPGAPAPAAPAPAAPQ